MSDVPARLTALSGAALITASVMVASVRGDIMAERYSIARSEQELSRVERRSRWVRVDLVATFGRWSPSSAEARGLEPSGAHPFDDGLDNLGSHSSMAGWQP
jgi:hypothetical protein